MVKCCSFFLYLLLLPFAVSAQSTEIFNEDGTPTAEFKAELRKEVAPELLRGVDLVGAYKGADGVWSLLEEDACITIRFHVSPEGKVDRYVTVDSEPEGLLERATLMAIANWRFAKSEKGAWGTLPLNVSVFNAVNTFGSDTRLSKASKVAGFVSKSSAKCVVPTVNANVELPQGERLTEDAEMPLAPRAAVRAAQAGCVTLAFAIAHDGSTADFEMLDAKPQADFIDAGVIAVSRWKFKASDDVSPRYGFVRFDFGVLGSNSPPVSCMEAKFAANHYQPTKESP